MRSPLAGAADAGKARHPARHLLPKRNRSPRGGKTVIAPPNKMGWCLVILTGQHLPSRARIIAGLSGFFTLIQSRDGPDR
jgi:hypothetical protein